MATNPIINYHEIRDELLKRLREPAPGRVQILSGPRQVEKTTLLTEIAEAFGERAAYFSADSTEAQMSGWWEQVVRAGVRRGDRSSGRDRVPAETDR